MKKLILILALGSYFVATRAIAQDSGFGAGIMLGEPTGISGKIWTAEDRAMAFGVAWGGFGRDGGYFHLHGDYIFHNFSLISVPTGKLALHYGAGLRLRTFGGNGYLNNNRDSDNWGGGTRLGIRIPVGLTYLVDGAPVDIFIEAVPTLDLIPGTSLDLDAALGARYYFGK